MVWHAWSGEPDRHKPDHFRLANAVSTRNTLLPWLIAYCIGYVCMVCVMFVFLCVFYRCVRVSHPACDSFQRSSESISESELPACWWVGRFFGLTLVRRIELRQPVGRGCESKRMCCLCRSHTRNSGINSESYTTKIMFVWKWNIV